MFVETNRRKFISSAVIGGVAAATLPLSSCGIKSTTKGSAQTDLASRYARLDEALKLPVFKKELFTSPVIIESIELLRDRNNVLCRVRSKDGAEGISAGHATSQTNWPVMQDLIQRFNGKDARDLDALIPGDSGKGGGIPFNIQLATLEFAILDMLGKTAKKSIGQLIGEIHNPMISVYQGSQFVELRKLPPEQSLELVKKDLLVSKAKAIKIRAGGGGVLDGDNAPGRTEKLIRMARETFGDKMVLMIDGNNNYSADGAIRIGKLLEEHNYYWWEEPVPYGWDDELKQVKDELNKIKIASGESDGYFSTFRWLIAHDALDIYQQDTTYFGGMIRSMKVARMAAAFGKTVAPHITNNGLGYIYMMQLISACPNAEKYQEFQLFTTRDSNGNQIPIEYTSGDPITSYDGVLKVPTGSGLGIRIDPDYVKTHKVVKDW